ncbi:MAG: hypothetical protein ACREOI_17445 [bacterium]
MRKSPVVVLFIVLLMAFAVVVMLSAQEKAAAKPETVTGTLVDLKCYSTAGVLTNDHGSAKGCGAACASGGLPVGLVDANKKVHVLGVSAPDYASYVGQELRFTGTHGKHADILIPEKLEVKENGKWVEKKLP